MKFKRICAYIIDILIVSTIASLIFGLPNFDDSRRGSNEAIDEMFELIKTNGSGEIDAEQISHLSYKTTYYGRYLTIIESALLIVYFGIIQYVTNGQTIGKRLMKLKIKPAEGKTLNPGLMFLRSIILHNVLFKIISVIAVIGCTEKTAMEISNYAGYLSIIVTIAIIGTIIFRNDEKGLHDLICHTEVVSTKKEK